MHKEVRNLCMKMPLPSFNGRATSLPRRLMPQSEPQHRWGRCDVAIAMAGGVLTHNFQKGFEDGGIPILQLNKENSKVNCHVHTNEYQSLHLNTGERGDRNGLICLPAHRLHKEEMPMNPNELTAFQFIGCTRSGWNWLAFC